MEYLIASVLIYLILQIINNPKYGYVKENNPQTGTNEPVNTESTTKGASTNDEGQEKTIFHPGLWL